MTNFDRIKQCGDECQMATLIHGYYCSNLHKMHNKDTGEWTSLPFLDWLRSDRNIFDEDVLEDIQ